MSEQVVVGCCAITAYQHVFSLMVRVVSAAVLRGLVRSTRCGARYRSFEAFTSYLHGRSVMRATAPDRAFHLLIVERAGGDTGGVTGVADSAVPVSDSGRWRCYNQGTCEPAKVESLSL